MALFFEHYRIQVKNLANLCCVIASTIRRAAVAWLVKWRFYRVVPQVQSMGIRYSFKSSKLPKKIIIKKGEKNGIKRQSSLRLWTLSNDPRQNPHFIKHRRLRLTDLMLVTHRSFIKRKQFITKLPINSNIKLS